VTLAPGHSGLPESDRIGSTDLGALASRRRVFAAKHFPSTRRRDGGAPRMATVKQWFFDCWSKA